MKTVKIKSLVPSLGFLNSPIGTILEVDEKTANRCIENKMAELVDKQEKEQPKVDLDAIDFDTILMGELREIAKSLGIPGTSRKFRKELTQLVKEKVQGGE